MTVKLLTEHHLEFLSLKGGCTTSAEPTLVKMPHCWKSHVVAHIYYNSVIAGALMQKAKLPYTFQTKPSTFWQLFHILTQLAFS